MAMAINNYQAVRENIAQHLNLTKSSQPPLPLQCEDFILKTCDSFL